MKPNKKVIREILSYVDDNSNGSKIFEKNSLAEFIAKKTFSGEEIAFANVQYLIDCNLLEHKNNGIRGLTPAGRMYLDLIENDENTPIPHSAEKNHNGVSVNIGSMGNLSGNFAVANDNFANTQTPTVFLKAFTEVQDCIDEDNSISAQDKILLRRLIAELEIIINENKPVSKGMLSRYRELFANHSAAVATVFQPFIYKLIDFAAKTAG